jgi:hypothetical protein
MRPVLSSFETLTSLPETATAVQSSIVPSFVSESTLGLDDNHSSEAYG